MFRTILFTVLFAMLVSACSRFNPAPLSTPSLPELGDSWTLRMDHSGGIVGLSRSIEVSSDGSYTVNDEREDKTVEGQLSPGDLATLLDLLDSLAHTALPETEDTNCADCFVYAIEFQGAGEPLRVQVDDTTLADSGLEPLVTFLRSVMDKALK